MQKPDQDQGMTRATVEAIQDTSDLSKRCSKAKRLTLPTSKPVTSNMMETASG